MSAKKKIVVAVVFAALGIISVLLGVSQDAETRRFFAAPLVLMAFMLHVVLFRCPHCGRWRGMSIKKIKRCPHCGEII